MYARAACSAQYGFPGTASAPQKWKSVSPGSPIGHRQPLALPRASTLVRVGTAVRDRVPAVLLPTAALRLSLWLVLAPVRAGVRFALARACAAPADSLARAADDWCAPAAGPAVAARGAWRDCVRRCDRSATGFARAGCCDAPSSDCCLIGDGRDGNFNLCALPTTAFFDTPRRLPISDALWPACQRRVSSSMRSSVQAILCYPS